MRHGAQAPIPDRLDKRPKDARGYPIPYTVMVDSSGKPHFTVNDLMRALEVAHEGRCALCGESFDKGDQGGAWFIGGFICFASPKGAFLDPPAHRECAQYALQVCPYLAAPSYGKRIDEKTLAVAEKASLVIHKAEEMSDERPQIFVLGQTRSYQVHSPDEGGMVMNNPSGVWERFQVWRHGEVITDEDEIKRLIDLDKQRLAA